MSISVLGGAGAGADAVPQRFRMLFARAARLLVDWAHAHRSGRVTGPATRSDLAAAGWSGGLEPDDEDEAEGGAAGGGAAGEGEEEVLAVSLR